MKIVNCHKEMERINQDCETKVFKIFDKDKDGHFNYSDLGMMLRWLKFNPTDRELKAFVEKYDQAKSMLIAKKVVFEIVDQKVMEPDTMEELIEAMKLLDTNRDGTIATNELRWAMTKLGDPLDEASVDDMIKEIDGDKGFVDIIEFAKVCFNIKEKKGKD